MKPADLVPALKKQASSLGFQNCRVAPAQLPETVGDRLRSFVKSGRHGDMTWMEETLDRRASPDSMWPEARSAIMLTMSYTPASDPLLRLEDCGLGNISVYAHGRDYHDVIKGKLKVLAQWLARTAVADVKVFVDTAPLMEKPLAQAAGLGWQGKHTNLVSRDGGSWLFLGVILTNAELPSDDAETDHCGSCQACIDICPTRAFPHAYQLDARRCISYLTIEHGGHIAPEFRHAMGNRIYGCDDCLAVCPWNKFAADAREAKLAARPEIANARLPALLQLDDPAFRKLFSASPVKRIGRNRFIRNVLIAAGNSRDVTLVSHVKDLLDDVSPVVRAMAVWALKQLDPQEFENERCRRQESEKDLDVGREWQGEATG